MTPYPVHFNAERPERFSRVQLLVRLVAFLALGALSVSFGTIFVVAYVGLSFYAAVRLSSLGSPRDYVREDGPRLTTMLRWLASVFAWVGLVADKLPAREAAETVSLQIEDTGPQPTPGTAILRIVTGLPSAVVLLVLGWIGIFVWFWAALTILVAERVGPGAFHYLVGLQRWSVRLFAYQACLVDTYPPFSFSEASPALPEAKAMA